MKWCRLLAALPRYIAVTARMPASDGQNLVEERRKLVDEKTAQTNRLTNHLKIYFPQILDWFEHLDSELVCALLADIVGQYAQSALSIGQQG